MKRIKNNDLTHYFFRDHSELPESYLKSCREFFESLGIKTKVDKQPAASVKQQAMQGSSCKQQAASFKQGWFESFINFQGASGKRQAPSSKHQAASHELLAL
jgi:hypothetical protein